MGLPPYDGWMELVAVGGLAGQAVVGRMPKAIRRINPIGGTPLAGLPPYDCFGLGFSIDKFVTRLGVSH